MKALVICASGNKTGTTYRMCQAFSDTVGGSQIVDLSELDIQDCNGCSSCKSGNGCIMEDGMGPIMEMMASAEILVLATPIRFSGPSSQMKRFLDRLNPFWHSPMKHPRYACAMMCGGSSNPKFSNARSEMVSASNTVGMEWLGELCISDTDNVPFDEKEVRSFAENILGKIRN